MPSKGFFALSMKRSHARLSLTKSGWVFFLTFARLSDPAKWNLLIYPNFLISCEMLFLIAKRRLNVARKNAIKIEIMNANVNEPALTIDFLIKR